MSILVVISMLVVSPLVGDVAHMLSMMCCGRMVNVQGELLRKGSKFVNVNFSQTPKAAEWAWSCTDPQRLRVTPLDAESNSGDI